MKNKALVTILRIVLGVIFMAHGIAKLQMGLDQVAGWFSSIDLPGFLAYPIAYFELIGGIALIVGFATRYLAGGYIVLLLGAIFTVKLNAGLLGNNQSAGYELDLALWALALYFFVVDESGYGLDQVIATKRKAVNV